MLLHFFYNGFLVWFPFVSALLFWLTAVVITCFGGEKRTRYIYFLLGAVLVATVSYAVLLTFVQYRVWLGSAFTRVLLTSPLSFDVPLFGLLKGLSVLRRVTWGYFAYYALYHFWLRLLLGWLLLILYYGLMRLLYKFREEVISSFDFGLLLFGALVTSWPNSLLFVFLSLLMTAVQMLLPESEFLDRRFPGVSLPVLGALLITVIMGRFILTYLGFGVLFL